MITAMKSLRRLPLYLRIAVALVFGVIAGLGSHGYLLALQALSRLLAR